MIKRNKLKLSVVCFTGNSGLTDYSVSLCNKLNNSCELNFITAESFDDVKYNVAFPVTKVFKRTRNYPVDIIKFIFLIKKNKPDVLLFESWIKYPLFEILIVFILRFLGIKVVLTVHDLLPHYPKFWDRIINSIYYRRFDRLITHSNRSVRELRNMGVVSEILNVPHGVYDIFNIDNLSRNQVKDKFPVIKKNDFVVLFFGHIETRKGILEFLKASEKLKEHEDIKFVVAGGNSLQSSDLKCFSEYKKVDNVLIYDEIIPIEQVQYFFTLCDVVALPYLEGTTSGVVKLAMAFNKPIVATSVGDFAETIVDWSGELIEAEDIVNSLSNAILKIKSQYSSYLLNLNANRRKYEWVDIAEKHLNFLQI